MRRGVSLLVALAAAPALLVALPAESDAQTAMRRRAERPLVPRSQARREADRAAERAAPRVYVPGHFVWDNRRGRYSWVAGRWERYDPHHAFGGGGLWLRDGQWTAGPVR